MLNQEQLDQIKGQLVEQIDQLFPKDKQEAAKRKILSMEGPELEEFLKQNNLIQNSNSENPFRLIVAGKIPSIKIDENKHCIAVLELNPISEGHSLVIPKTPVKEGRKIPEYLNKFAKKIAKKIKLHLKPKDIQVTPTPLFDETIINILPIYDNETLNSKRNSATPEDLQKTLHKINKKIIKKTKPKPKKITPDEKLWLPKRIP